MGGLAPHVDVTPEPRASLFNPILGRGARKNFAAWHTGAKTTNGTD